MFNIKQVFIFSISGYIGMALALLITAKNFTTSLLTLPIPIAVLGFVIGGFIKLGKK